MTRALRIWAWILLADLLVRSIDYLSGGDVVVPDDNLAVPEIWGVAGLVTCIVILVGLVTKSSGVLKSGAITAFAVYLMISIQMFEIAMLPYPWPPENPRLSVVLLVLALLWLSLACIVWWREYVAKETAKEAMSG